MKENILIIGDIAGRYDELLRVEEAARKVHSDFSVISVGDMVDRGPASPAVVEHFRTSPDHYAVLGNHEHMMIDWYSSESKYPKEFRWDVWLGNGGDVTKTSYEVSSDPNILQRHLEYLKTLPDHLSIPTEQGDILVTHAPVHPVLGLTRQLELPLYDIDSILWNRMLPVPSEKYAMQFFGHNAVHCVQFCNYNDNPYAVNVDTSRGRKLSGVFWPSLEIVESSYTERKPS